MWACTPKLSCHRVQELQTRYAMYPYRMFRQREVGRKTGSKGRKQTQTIKIFVAQLLKRSTIVLPTITWLQRNIRLHKYNDRCTKRKLESRSNITPLFSVPNFVLITIPIFLAPACFGIVKGRKWQVARERWHLLIACAKIAYKKKLKIGYKTRSGNAIKDRHVCACLVWLPTKIFIFVYYTYNLNNAGTSLYNKVV